MHLDKAGVFHYAVTEGTSKTSLLRNALSCYETGWREWTKAELANRTPGEERELPSRFPSEAVKISQIGQETAIIAFPAYEATKGQFSPFYSVWVLKNGIWQHYLQEIPAENMDILDLNGDGKIDLITRNKSGNSTEIIVNLRSPSGEFHRTQKLLLSGTYRIIKNGPCNIQLKPSRMKNQYGKKGLMDFDCKSRKFISK